MSKNESNAIVVEAEDQFESLTPEEKLLLSVIDMAILDINRPIVEITEGMSKEYITLIHLQRKYKRDAIKWMRSSSVEKWSLNWMCDILDIPKYKILELIKDNS